MAYSVHCVYHCIGLRAQACSRAGFLASQKRESLGTSRSTGRPSGCCDSLSVPPKFADYVDRQFEQGYHPACSPACSIHFSCAPSLLTLRLLVHVQSVLG